MDSSDTPILLTFETLDDISLLPAAKMVEVCHSFENRIAAKHLGPVVEYAFQHHSQNLPIPDVGSIIRDPKAEAVQHWQEKQPADRAPSGAGLDPRDFEIVGTRDNEKSSILELMWTAYWKRFQRAAEKAGFNKKTASGLSGAAQEMCDNIIWHSERLGTGLVAYRWSAGEFEFVVADQGIGVLNSLRTCPEHSELSDHGTALNLVLGGRSRFGSGSGHGNGFRQVFISLANLHGSLRFRSGDHSAEIEGEAPALSTVRCSQRSFFQGFMTSVICRPK